MSKYSRRGDARSDDERDGPDNPSSSTTGARKKYPIIIESALVLRERAWKKLEEREKRRQLREEKKRLRYREGNKRKVSSRTSYVGNSEETSSSESGSERRRSYYSFMERELRARAVMLNKDHEDRLRERERERERLSIKELRCQQDERKLQPSRQRYSDVGGLDQVNSRRRTERSPTIRTAARGRPMATAPSPDKSVYSDRTQSTDSPSCRKKRKRSYEQSYTWRDVSDSEEMDAGYYADRDDHFERNIPGSGNASLYLTPSMSDESFTTLPSTSGRGPKTPPLPIWQPISMEVDGASDISEKSDEIIMNESHDDNVEKDVQLDVNRNSLTLESLNLQKHPDQHVGQHHQLHPVSEHLGGSSYARRVSIESNLLGTGGITERVGALSLACTSANSVDRDGNRASGQPISDEQSAHTVRESSGEGAMHLQYCAECNAVALSAVCEDEQCPFRLGMNIN